MKNNQGVILVLTLVIMSILLATAISFAVFIISDIKQAKSIDDSIAAYYAADTGIERSLYQFRKLDIRNVSGLTPNDSMASSSAFWNIAKSTDTESVIIRQRLYNGQSVKFFFLNRGDGSNPVKRIGVVWRKGGGSNSNMQVTFTQLAMQTSASNQSTVYYTDQNSFERADSNETGSGFCYEFKDAILGASGRLEPLPDYVVEIKALGAKGDYIENLKVQAYNANDCSGSPLGSAISNIAIVSEGTQNQSVQKITAQIPPRDPASGILGFVLFSEEDITKQ